ncbi:MAG: glycosyltransferase [Bacteroidetes bacterium]|nr:glycosyltransferase [Bacteroidota bacterium]MBS1941241.1 glycosyltransferase [Bacteroidota bacterium]
MMPGRFHFSTAHRTHVATYAAEGAVLLGTVVVYKLAALHFGNEGFEPYAVVRRTISFLQTVLLFGLGVALVRFVALSGDRAEQVGLLHAVVKPISLVGVVLLAACALAPAAFSRLFFGDASHTDLILPVGLLTFGLLMHAVIYSFWRGTMEMGKANVLQVVNLAVVPNVAMWWGPSMSIVLWSMGIAWCICSAIGLIPVLLKRSTVISAADRSRLLRYGIPRVPGDLVLASLLTIPVYLVNHVSGLAAGAQVAFGLTLVNLASSAYSPISLLLLPKAAAMLAEKRWQELERRTRRIAWMALVSGIAMVAVFQAIASPLLRWYLGETGSAMVTTCRIVFIGAIFMGVFVSLRSILDAYYTAPRNTFNLLGSLGLFVVGVVGYLWFQPFLNFALVATVVAPLALLAWLTWSSIAWMRHDLRSMDPGPGHVLRVLVVIPGSPGTAGMPFSHRQAEALRAKHGYDVRTYLLSTRTSIRGLLKARRELNAIEHGFRPDVVHVHYGTVTALFTLLTVRCPLVVTFHGSDLNPTPTDGVWRDRIGRFLSQLAALGATGIICVSEGLRQRLWWRKEDAVVVPIGTDTDQFHPMDRQECCGRLAWPQGPVVLFNAGNPKLKRLDLAQAALTLVNKSVPDARLMALQGQVKPEDMPVMINASDVVLLCSDAEGSPTMVKEAMACNVPVVSNDVGDVAERLSGVRPGALVEQRADAFAAGILAVLADGRRSNGREELVRQGFTSLLLDGRVAALLRNCTWYRSR